MKQEWRTSRAILSLLLTLLATGSGFVPSLLERDVDVRVSLESEHDPSHCPGVHDHTVCRQIDATQGLPAIPVRSRDLSPVALTTVAAATRDVRQTGLSALPPARAPPA